MAVREDPPVTGKGAWFTAFLAECMAMPGIWMKHDFPVSPGTASEIKGKTSHRVPGGNWDATEKGVDADAKDATTAGLADRKKSVWLYAKYTAPLDGNKGEDGAAGAV